MTITTKSARNEYTSAAAQTVFNYSFKIFSNTDLNVYITPAGAIPSDIADITTSYTVDAGTIGDSAGGFITMDVGVTADYLVTIVSNVPESRTTDYQFNGDFLPDTVNDDFDRVVQITKQIEDRATRTLTFQEGQQSAANLNLPFPVEGAYLTWGPFGDGVKNAGAPAIILDDESVATLAELVASSNPEAGDVVKTLGRISAGDGGNSEYLARAITGTPGDLGHIIKSVGNPAIEFVNLFPGGFFTLAQFGAVGDGVVDDTAALDDAEQAILNTVGTGTLYIPTGQYLRTTPWELSQGISLQGEGQDHSAIIKTNAVVDSRGRNSVIALYDKTKFRIKDIGTKGDKNVGVPGTSYGLMIQGSSYFRIDNMRNRQHKHGLYLKTCWLCNIDSTVSQQCEEYGYRFETACTSITLTGPTSWGCGGHVVMVGCLYCVINSGAYDHGDAGNFPTDPFLPIGSGGDYQNPEYVFSITASQGITINSPGTESGYSKYIYMEGAQVVLNAPYCYLLEGYATNWNFIELRGTGISDLTINNPWFTSVENTLTPAVTRSGIFIENSTVQTVRLNKFLKLSDSFGQYEFSTDGIEYTYTTDMLRMDQANMDIGGTNPTIPDAGGSISIVNVAGVKEAQFANTIDDTYFVAPLPEKGTIKIHTRGTFSSGFDVFRMKIRVVGGADLKEWTDIDTDDYYTIDSIGVPVEFAIRKYKAADTLKMTELIIEHIV